MDTPGSVVVTKYGDADVAQFPLEPLVASVAVYDEETGEQTVSEEPLRADDNDVARVLLHGYRTLKCPKAERALIEMLAPKYTAILAMDGIHVGGTTDRYLVCVQCFWRTVQARKLLRKKREMWEVADVIEKWYRVFFQTKTAAAIRVQCQFRRGHAHQRLLFLFREVDEAIRLQCAWRQFLARRALENRRTVWEAQVLGTSR